MGLFDPAIVYQLTPVEAEIFERPIHGNGGAQVFLRELQVGYNPATRIGSIELDQLDRVMKYAFEYGGGGLQQRFKVILAGCQRAGWKMPRPPRRKPAEKGAWNA